MTEEKISEELTLVKYGAFESIAKSLRLEIEEIEKELKYNCEIPFHNYILQRLEAIYRAVRSWQGQAEHGLINLENILKKLTKEGELDQQDISYLEKKEIFLKHKKFIHTFENRKPYVEFERSDLTGIGKAFLNIDSQYAVILCRQKTQPQENHAKIQERIASLIDVTDTGKKAIAALSDAEIIAFLEFKLDELRESSGNAIVPNFSAKEIPAQVLERLELLCEGYQRLNRASRFQFKFLEEVIRERYSGGAEKNEPRQGRECPSE